MEKEKKYSIGDNTYLSYEGEYLNGLRNGKGKDYYYAHIFEGEYYNEHRLKGKYFLNGKLEYEGEFLFGKKYNGKGYDSFGNITYELNNGTGKVKEYNECDMEGKSYFEGEYLNGLKSGKGKIYNNEGILIFEGNFLNGQKNGKGKEFNKDGQLIFEGDYFDNERKEQKIN